MKLYLYNKHNLELFMVVEGEVAHDGVIALDDGSVMIPPENIEASSKADLSEKLRERKQTLSPDLDARVAALEEAMAMIIYGGEINAQY